MSDAPSSMGPGSRSVGDGHLDARALLLTVIIPVFNEARTIDQLLVRVLAASPTDKQVIVVNDGSTDETAAVLKQWPEKEAVEILRHSVNRGKGCAIRTALERARGCFTIIQDADLEYDPQDYGRVLQPLRTGKAQVVFGSRYLTHPIQAGGWVFRCGVKVLNIMVRVLYGVGLTDEATCYKATSTSLLRQMDLQCERFEFCPELTAKACRLGLKILEVPISYHPRGVKAGKKIRWKDGLEAMSTLWKWRHWQPVNDPARQGSHRGAALGSGRVYEANEVAKP